MRARTTWMAILLAVLMAVGLATPGVADSTHSKKKQLDATIKTLKQDLAETSASLRDAAIALATAKSALPEAQAAVSTAEKALAQASARDKELVQALSVAVKQEEKATRELSAVGARIDEQEQSLGALANAAYRQGGMGQLAVALEADSPNQFADRLVLVQTATRAGDEVVNELARAKADMRNTQARLEAKRAQVAQMREESRQLVEAKRKLSQQAKAAKARVDKLVAERTRAMQAIAREKAAEQKRIAAMQAESRRLQKVLQARALASRSSGRVVIGSGVLSRPIAGPITSPYGMRVHPVTGIYKLHDGTDFGAGCGSPIRAADDGTVVQATYLTGYGNQTVIDHGVVNGRSLATSYSHQSRFGVRAGEHVSRGEVIGYVGSTGYSTGCHLHFMVYVNGNVTNPMSWL
jgi:murein DD-endopeptidase MepM/ murein hydrolase activator NlpD